TKERWGRDSAAGEVVRWVFGRTLARDKQRIAIRSRRLMNRQRVPRTVAIALAMLAVAACQRGDVERGEHAAKEPSKQTASEPAREPERETSNEAAKEATKETT